VGQWPGGAELDFRDLAKDKNNPGAVAGRRRTSEIRTPKLATLKCHQIGDGGALCQLQQCSAHMSLSRSSKSEQKRSNLDTNSEDAVQVT
jgi:hypothetical protein